MKEELWLKELTENDGLDGLKYLQVTIDVLPLNIYPEVLPSYTVTVSGISILCKSVHSLNADVPIDSTVLGILIFVIPLH